VWVEDFLVRHGDGLPVQHFSTTGLRIDLPSAGSATPARPAAPDAGGRATRGRKSGGPVPARRPPRAVASRVVAELDAVISPAHPDADPTTGAVHACGHHTQTGIALSTFAHLVSTGAWKQASVDLSFVFVPAEEFVDLAGRAQMRERGEITWFGGKPEAMMLGVFDDIDAAVCLHAIGGLQDGPTVEIDCDPRRLPLQDRALRGQRVPRRPGPRSAAPTHTRWRRCSPLPWAWPASSCARTCWCG
jgi:hypothetical protein